MDKRPTLNSTILISDFREFYWLKEELVRFCKREGLKTDGGKLDIANRIESYIITGVKPEKRITSKVKKQSKFDWNTEVLLLSTTITDSYKNTENVRAFFISHLGHHFKFNVKFMNWMKTNSGKTLENAIMAWQQIKIASKDISKPKVIAAQFEYNTYLRDFLKDNPNLSRALGISLWKIKKSKRGDNVYSRLDLKYIDKD